jgi:agarase
MFNWLPEYGDDLADHYSYRRSVLRGPVEHGETFSFYGANLERRYGQTEPESYFRKWEEVTLDRMLDWGFTSFGNWVDPAFYPNEQVPYFANGWIIGNFKTLASKYDVWAAMPDPFDPEFVRRAKITIDRIAEEIQGSPWCIGVFVDNEKSWGYPEGTVEQRYGVILDGLSRDAKDSPAKAAFTEFLRKKHGSIAALNDSWETEIATWEELATGFTTQRYAPGLEEDLSALLEFLSEEYFRVVHDTLENALPHHLYMGARMANWGMPKETIKAAVRYSDVLSFNIYEEGIQPKAWAFLDEVDLPTVIGEWHIGATRETGLYHPGLVMADGQADRARMWRAYMDSVLAQDTMVGAHWFQYIDSPISGRAFDGENYNVGFVAVTDIPYPEMVEAAREFNRQLYARRYSTDNSGNN